MQTVLSWNGFVRRFLGNAVREEERRRCGRWRLEKNGVLPVFSGEAGRVRCVAGRVWITDGSAGDVILGAGEVFSARRGRKLVIEALEASVVEMDRVERQDGRPEL